MFNPIVVLRWFTPLALAFGGSFGAVALHSDKTGNIFLPDEPLNFTLTGEAGDLPEGAELTVALSDYHERVLHARELPARAAGERRVLRAFSWPSLGTGYYRMRVEAGGRLLAETSLGVVAPPEPGRAAGSGRFGTIAHLKRMDDADRTRMFELISRCGIGWIREGFLWHELEPERGRWQWDRYDDIVNRAGRLGISVLPVLCFTADWASTAPSDLPPEKRRRWPPAEADWEGYVRAVVGRYKDRIRTWEVWNEPNLATFWQPQPDAAQYASLLEGTYRVAKEVSPDAILVSAGLTPSKADHPKSLRHYEEVYVGAMIRGTSRPFDALGYHPYTLFDRTVSNALTARRFATNIQNLFDGLGDGAEASPPPLWFTEMGTSTIPRIVSESRAAEYLVVVMTCALATPNAQRAFWYNFRDVGTNPEEKEDMFGLVHHDYTPKPGYLAYHTFIRKMSDVRFASRSAREGVTVNKFSGDGKELWVVWADDAPADIKLEIAAPSVRVTDAVGVTIEQPTAAGALALRATSSPVYVEFLSQASPAR